MGNYDIKDVSKKVKDRLYKKYPNYNFSVTSERGMTDSLYIYWLGADFYPFIEKNVNTKQINTYYINEITGLTSKGVDVVKNIYEIAKEYQTSYERGDNHRVKNFYLNIEVGKWDKPFTVTEPTTKSVSSNRGKGWEWGDTISYNNGWTLYNKTLDDGRIVYNFVKDKSVAANKDQWNEIRGEVYTETGFKWSPKTQSFQHWGDLSKKDNYTQIINKLYEVIGKYYVATTPSTSTTTLSKQNLTDKSPATAFDIVYRENQEDFDLSNDYNMFAERMSLKYLMNADQWNYLLSEFEKKGNKEFVVNESYKSIPDNPKLDFFTIKDSEGLPEYVELLPRTFKSFKQATKFIADNIGDLEKRGYDKHYVEWKFVYDVAGNEVFADRWDVGVTDANPNMWSNLWAYQELVSCFFDALFYNKPTNDAEYQKANNLFNNLGKEGMELTKEEFYKIVNYFCLLNYDVKRFPNYTTESSRLQRIKEVFPTLFSIFDKEQAITAEVIEMKIKALSVLAKYGDELAAKKIKVLQILLKK
jgi:hypothetical protein